MITVIYGTNCRKAKASLFTSIHLDAYKLIVLLQEVYLAFPGKRIFMDVSKFLEAYNLDQFSG